VVAVVAAVTVFLAEAVALVVVQPVEQITEPLIRAVEEVVVLLGIVVLAAPVSLSSKSHLRTMPHSHLV
jgi:hypothetical protein